MSDQQQASLHKWEIVAQGDQGGNGPIIRSAVTRVHTSSRFCVCPSSGTQTQSSAIVKLTGGCYRSGGLAVVRVGDFCRSIRRGRSRRGPA